MKIGLVNPPRSPYNSILSHAPQDVLPFIHKKLIGPPLGLLTIAAAVRHHDVSLLEMKAEYDLHPDAPDVEELTMQWLEREHPRLVGVTFIASEYTSGIRILQTVKRFDPTIVTVVGGLHVTLSIDDFVVSCVDIAIPGTAYRQFRELVDVIEKKGDMTQVKGILFRDEGELHYTGMPALPDDPCGQDMVVPDRSLLAPWKTTYRVGGNPELVTYLYTSLGCPYRCTFCSIWPQYRGKAFLRSVESIVNELHTLDDYGVVRFADANSVIDPVMMNTLFDRIIAEGIKKTFVMDIRFDTVVAYPDLVEKMARAGLKVVICGFESYRQSELDLYHKKSSATMIEKAVALFDAHAIMVRGNYVVPPDYTEDDFVALAEYASAHKVVYAGYTVLTPMPGTLMYKKIREQIIDHNLEKYNFFNSVLPTKLPIDDFYHRVASLWRIKKGTETI